MFTTETLRKGCPKESCERHIDKVMLMPTEEYCPKCGTRLTYVCSMCFQQINGDDIQRGICSKCAKKHIRKRGSTNNKSKIWTSAKGVIAPIVIGITGIVVRDMQKCAIEKGARVVKPVIKGAAKTVIKTSAKRKNR